MIASSFARRATLAGLATLCAFPTAALADDPPGGLALDGTAATAPAPPAAAPTAKSPGSTAQLAGAGTWGVAAATASVGKPVKISGHFRTTLAGRRVRVERRTPSGRWLKATTARVAGSGRFTAVWRTRSARYHDLRVVLAGKRRPVAASKPSDRAGTRASATEADDTVRVAVLGRARATWFGPGLYGRTTACGMTLRPDTVGVAHRTLPCGTKVEVRMGRKTAVLPVIDRGPFANGADFDLTKNVADDLGLDGVGTVRFFERDDLPRLVTPEQAPASR